MSQFEQGSPMGRVVRRGGDRAPSMGITETASAPGLAILTPVSQGRAIADQFLVAIRASGNLGSAIAETQRRIEYEDRVAFNADQGLGVQSAREAMPALQRQILEGKTGPSEGESPEAWAERLAASATDGLSPGVQKGYRDALVPRVLDAYTVRSSQLEKIATDEHNKALVAAAEVMDTPEGIRSVIDDYLKVNPDATPRMAATVIAGAAAERAAMAGNSAQLDAAIAAGDLGTIDPSGSAKYRAVLDRTQKQHAVENDLSDRKAFEEFAATNPSPVALAEKLDTLTAADPGWKNDQRARIERAKANEFTKIQGAYANQLAADTFLGRFPDGDPVKAAEAIARRMLTPESDVMHLDADKGRQLIEFIDKSLKVDARAALVDHALSTPGSSTVLTDADSSAIMRSLGHRGIVRGAEIGEGKFALQGVADPLGLAAATDKVRVIPNDVQDWIRNGATSSDQAQAAQSLTTYAAIYAQNPQLAASINLPPDAAARARYVVSRLENGDPSWKYSNQSLSDAVAPLVRTAVKIDPEIAKLDDSAVLGTVFFKDPAAKATYTVNFEPQVASKISKAVREQVDAEIGDAPKVIPGQLADEYRRNLVDEYKVQRSLTTDDQKAAEAASAWAMRKTIADNPPSNWGGVVRFQRKGQPTMPEAVAKALRDEVKASVDSDTADSLWSRYFPVYTTQTKSGKPGFMFVPTDGSQTPFTVGGGATLVVNLPDPKTEKVYNADTRLQRFNTSVMNNPELRAIIAKNRGLVLNPMSVR